MTTVMNINNGETCDVLIDRSSKWGNPFSHLPNTKAQFQVKTRKEAIEQYKVWFWNQPQLVEALPELENKRLGCHCKPKECHGDFLAYITNHYRMQ